jgi:hypothetical protein
MLGVDKCEALVLRQAIKNDIRNHFFPVYIEALHFETYMLKCLQDIETDPGYLDVVYMWSGLVSVSVLVSSLDLICTVVDFADVGMLGYIAVEST